MTQRQSKNGLIGVSIVGKGRNVEILKNIYDLLSWAKRIQSINLADGALDGSLDISRKGLDFSLVESRA